MSSEPDVIRGWIDAELETLRDDLAERVSKTRRSVSDRTYPEDQNRRRIERMLLEPDHHKWVRVSNEDIGEPGCRHWHVRGALGRAGNADELVARAHQLRLPVSHLTAAAR